MRRSFLATVCWLGLGWPLAGCGRREGANDHTTLRLAIDLWAGYFPALLADELGHFREAGVQVQISIPGNTDRMMAEFLAGRHDLVGIALADLVNLSRGGHEVQVVLQSDESAGGDKILLREGFDLQGQRVVVGTNLGGFGELFVREFLARSGVPLSRVVWVNVDASEVGQALHQRQIDIGHCWEPYAAAALAQGARTVFTSADTPGLIPDVVAASRSTIERRRQDVRAFAAGWFRALAWWSSHLDEGNRHLAKRLDKSPEWVADSLRGVRLVSLPENHRMLGHGSTPPAMAPVLTRYSEFFLKHGSLTRPLRAEAVLRGDLLP